MTSAFIRMQELIMVSAAAAAQPPEQAPAVGFHRALTMQARMAQTPVGGGPVTLTSEHSLSRSEESFEATDTPPMLAVLIASVLSQVPSSAWDSEDAYFPLSM